MSQPLSPAAQAVRCDLSQIMHEMSQRCRVSISATDTLPITLETNYASLQAGINNLCAAALRAVADQVVPEAAEAVGDQHDEARRDQWLRIRWKFLAIAAELEGSNG